MGSTQRQLSNAIGMIIAGYLADDIGPEKIETLLQVLLDHAKEWSEVSLENGQVSPLARELIADHHLEP